MRRFQSVGLCGLCVVSLVAVSCSSSTKSSVPKPSDAKSAGTTTTSAASAGSPVQKVASPTVTGPITGAEAAWSAVTSPSADYTTAEYFLSGTATSYKPVGALGSNGKWKVEPAAKADYETRILVHRPADPAKFNGTVVVEWLNVSAGFETAPDFMFEQRELQRAGYAWVGVSAQAAGIDGKSAGVLGIKPLKQAAPTRYAPLHHPGDEYSYDIYSQAAAAVRETGASSPLGGQKAVHVIADGESQSAFRMVNYIDAVQPLTHSFDGFIVHSRWAVPTPLMSKVSSPANARIRSDLSQPVMLVQSETDVPKYASARQPDTAHIRTWEIAGTSHVDNKVLGSALGCSTKVNDGPEVYVMDAALAGLNIWMANPDKAPPTAPRIELDAKGAIVRDANGNALGGLRTPQLDVPLATLSGEGGAGSGFCAIAGTTTPFSPAKVATLYGSKASFLEKFDAAANRTIAKGYLLKSDLPEMHAEAAKNYPMS